MTNENQKELARILAEPNRRLDTQKSPLGKRRHEISPEAQSIGLDTVIRRPLPILGGTFEKFAVSSEYLDDQRAETVKAAYLPNESSVMYENASRFQNISGQAYDSETLTEELLESLRPKYDLLIPQTLLNSSAKSELTEERDAMEEGYRVMHKAAANLHCEFRETEIYNDSGEQGDTEEQLPEIALLDSIAHMEQRLRIPEFAKLSVMHPETAIRAVEESMNLAAAAKDSGRSIVDMRQLKDAEGDFNDLGKYFIGTDQNRMEIPPKLLNQLNLITPRSTRKVDSNALFNDENRIHHDFQNAGELVQRSMKKLLRHPHTPAALARADSRFADGSIRKKAHGVYEVSENTDGFAIESGGLRPLSTNENPLFIYPLVPSESWDFCHLVDEVNPCGELKLRHAPKIIEMLSERSIDNILTDLDEARHAHFTEIRREKERINAIKMAEALQQEREFEAELLTRRKLDAKAAAQAKAANVDQTKGILSVQDIMRPLDEATALLDEAEANTFGDNVLLGGETAAHIKESPAALKKRLELEKLADSRNAHYNSFSNWHSQHILPVLEAELSLSEGQCNVRSFVRHLERIYEMQSELKPVLSWSETDEPNLTDRLMRETKPDFNDPSVIKRLIKEDREDSLRTKTREILKCLLHLPKSHFKASTRLSRPSLDNTFCTKILYQGIIWQPTFNSHRGFVWAVAYETALVLYNIPKSTPIACLGFPTVSAKSIEGSIVAILSLANVKVSLRKNEELAPIFNATMNERGVLNRHSDRSDQFESRFSKMFFFTAKDISAQARGLVNFRFTTSPDEPIFGAWVLALTHACAYTRHCARVGSPWPSVQSCLTILDVSTLDLSSQKFDAEEVAQILKDLDMRLMTNDGSEPIRTSQVGIKSIDLRGCDLVASDITKLASLVPGTFLTGWFLAGNPKLGKADPNELFTNGILNLSKHLKELDLSECELRDSADLGRVIGQLIITQPELTLLNLQNNTLGTKFVHGMTSFFNGRPPQTASPERVDKPRGSGRLQIPHVQATDLLLSNNALNNACAEELVETMKHSKIIGYLNVNGCALIQHGFLANLMEENPDLLLRSDERSNVQGSSLAAVCQVASKSNTLRLYLLPWQRSLTGPLHIEEVRFPTGLLSSLVQKVAQQKRCFIVRLRQCAGDMFMAHDLSAAFNAPTYRFRVLDLSYSDWYSPETQKSAEEYYVAQGSMSIDGRLLNVLETTQAYNVRELTLAHTAAFDGSIFEAKHVAEFIFKLITQSDLEVLDLTGCDIGEDVFRILCQLLATKRTSDEVRDAFYLDEHGSQLITETWQRTSLIGKKQLRIAAKLDTTSGGLKRQWAIRVILLDHCTRITQNQIRTFVKLLVRKAPLLYILSIAEIINRSWASLESWKIPGFDPQIVQGATADGLPKSTEGEDLKLPSNSATDELAGIKNHLLMSRLYVDARNRLRRFDISDDEAFREKDRVIQSWLVKLEESKTHQRTARRRLRKRQLQKFFSTCQKRGEKSGRLSRRMPSTVEILRDNRAARIKRREARIGCSVLNDGIFPPYRLPSNLFYEIHMAKNGLYRPTSEFEKFLQKSTERILDLSFCYYHSYLMEDFVAKIVEKEPQNRSAHLEAIKLVNCGFDSAHAIDLAQIVGHYDIRCDNLDLSINQLEADRGIFREALITLIINLQVKTITLDCNLFMDSKNLAEVLIIAITWGICEVISVRHNGLGKVFIKHLIRKCDEILLESLNEARKGIASVKPVADKSTGKLAMDLGGSANRVFVGTTKSARARDNDATNVNDQRTGVSQTGTHQAAPPTVSDDSSSPRSSSRSSPRSSPRSSDESVNPNASQSKDQKSKTSSKPDPVSPKIRSHPGKDLEGSPPPLVREFNAQTPKSGRRIKFAPTSSEGTPSKSPETEQSSDVSKNTPKPNSSSSPAISSSGSGSNSESDGSGKSVNLNRRASAQAPNQSIRGFLRGSLRGSLLADKSAAGKTGSNVRAAADKDFEEFWPKPRANTCLKQLAAAERQQNALDRADAIAAKEPTQLVRKYIARRSDLKHMLKVLDLRSNPDLPAADILLLTTKLQLICPDLLEVRVDQQNMAEPQSDALTSEHLRSLKHPTHPGVFSEDKYLLLSDTEAGLILPTTADGRNRLDKMNPAEPPMLEKPIPPKSLIKLDKPLEFGGKKSELEKPKTPAVPLPKTKRLGTQKTELKTSAMDLPDPREAINSQAVVNKLQNKPQNGKKSPKQSPMAKKLSTKSFSESGVSKKKAAPAPVAEPDSKGSISKDLQVTSPSGKNALTKAAEMMKAVKVKKSTKKPFIGI